jgi:predicted PurR-regulated permease PerM
MGVPYRGVVALFVGFADLIPLVGATPGSILIGVELFGFLGALLAIPVAGVVQAIGRDLSDGYRGRLKTEPTTGTDEVPVSQPRPLEPGEQQPRDVTTDAHR